MTPNARTIVSQGQTIAAPSGDRLTGGVLFLLAGLAALGALATNIILPVSPGIGASLGVSSQQLGRALSGFFIAFALGQLLVGLLSEARFYASLNQTAIAA